MFVFVYAFRGQLVFRILKALRARVASIYSVEVSAAGISREVLLRFGFYENHEGVFCEYFRKHAFSATRFCIWTLLDRIRW